MIWKKTQAASVTLDAIGGTGENDVWVTGRNGNVFVSAGDDVWTQRPTDVNFDLYGIWGTAPDNVWVAVNANIVLHWTGKWTHESQGIKAGTTFEGITGTSARDIYVAGGPLLRSAGDGIWTDVLIPGQGTLLDIWAVGPNEIVAADATRVHLIKDGVATTLGRPGLPQELGSPVRGLWASSSSNVYVVKAEGIAHSRGDGTWVVEHTWNTLAEQDGGAVIWGASPTDIYVATVAGRLLRSRGDGRWSVFEFDGLSTASQDPVGIWGTSSGNVYIACDSGYVYHSRSMGN